MKLKVMQPGMLTTVQDEGRWGFQGKGMPVAGAMDLFALRSGNIMVGNDKRAAGLEVTVLGPTLSVVEGRGTAVVTGADLGFSVNGECFPCNVVVEVKEGDHLSFSGVKGNGCRAYLVFSGGIDVPVIMGSRSTYLRAHLGGLEGRALKKGDTFSTGEPHVLWERFIGFSCPASSLPGRQLDQPLRVVMGPQDDAFTDRGIETFLSQTYTISDSADRMGYRLEGPVIEHSGAADIISDAIPLGTIQIPGHGQPIAMLADRQTTGGYTKIAVLCTPDIGALAQRLPGQKVRFQKISFEDAVAATRKERSLLDRIHQLVATWITPIASSTQTTSTILEDTPRSGMWRLSIDGTGHTVHWERLD